MMKFVYRDAFHVITFPDEIITFTTLASYLHVHIRKQSVSVVVIAINEGAEIYGLEVVENLEVLFNHTPVVDFRLVLDKQHPNYEKVERTARFMREVYGYQVSVVHGTTLSAV